MLYRIPIGFCNQKLPHLVGKKNVQKADLLLKLTSLWPGVREYSGMLDLRAPEE